MDHQTQMNGSSASPARNVARNMADVWHDVLTLSELQVKLTAIDAREALAQSRLAIALMAAGCCLGMAALPILLAAGALLIVQLTTLDPAAAFGVAALAGLLIAGSLMVCGWWVMRREFGAFRRSRGEWSRNMDWLKNMLAHRGDPVPRQNSSS